MSPQLALVGLTVVPPIAGIAILYGRFVRKITKNVQVSEQTRNLLYWNHNLQFIHIYRLCFYLVFFLTNYLQDALAEATQVAEERIGNIRTVKAFSQEEREVDTYGDKMKYVLDLATKESFARGVFYGMVSTIFLFNLLYL